MSDVYLTQLINISLWEVARWSATAFQFHPTGECPPVLGIAFDDADAGREIFSEWVAMFGNDDQFEEIRVSIIEGDLPGQRPGYTVHISPDPVSIAARATAEGIALDPKIILLGRFNRMHPPTDSPPLLARFKEEVRRHGEYLLAPVTRRSDDQLWTDVEFGIVKSSIQFRDVSDIGQDDLDACVMSAGLIPPGNSAL
ncbi:MAG: hypothetical protein WD845_00290 [Pirellulales bacterium]